VQHQIAERLTPRREVEVPQIQRGVIQENCSALTGHQLYLLLGEWEA
jgi:hypothetical protein